MRDLDLTFRMAKRMQKHRQAAANIRLRYLYDRIEDCFEFPSDISMQWASEDIEEALYLLSHCNDEEVVYEGINLDVEAAREYPVERLIDFQKGKAYAWCHNDKTPSLTKMKHENLVFCWPCRKAFNPIDILMSRDNLSFQDAVRSLT